MQLPSTRMYVSFSAVVLWLKGTAAGLLAFRFLYSGVLNPKITVNTQEVQRHPEIVYKSWVPV